MMCSGPLPFENISKKNTKKIIGTVVDVLIWVLVVLCVGVSIVAVSAGTNAKNVPTVGSTCFLNVKTESMDAEKPDGVPADKTAGFSAGTMLLSKYIAEDDAALDALEVGDIITFEIKLDGSDTVDYNTHRIVAVERNENGTLVSVTTKGDNNDLVDGGQVSRGTIIAVYDGVPKGGTAQTLAYAMRRGLKTEILSLCQEEST